MLASTVMWSIIAGVLMIIGILMIREAESKFILAIGVLLFITGLGIGIWAQINLYVNGTTEDLTKYLFWFGGR